jgi:hypothetical protein
MAYGERELSAGGGIGASERPLGLMPGIVLALLALAFLFLAMWFVDSKGVAIEILIREPAAQFNFWPFSGFFSHAGVAALFATGVVCLFAASHAARDRGLLRLIAVYSLVLAVDDFFLVHDDILPRKGIPETATYTVYLLVGCAVAFFWRRDLFAVRHAALFLAGALLAASVVFDVVTPYSRLELVVEDSLKLAGLCVWAAYWIARAGTSMAKPARVGPAG